jgi:hypothetical protein
MLKLGFESRDSNHRVQIICKYEFDKSKNSLSNLKKILVKEQTRHRVEQIPEFEIT